MTMLVCVGVCPITKVHHYDALFSFKKSVCVWGEGDLVYPSLLYETLLISKQTLIYLFAPFFCACL